MADSPLKIVQDALKANGFKGPRLRSWREAVRERTGHDGSVLWNKIADLAEGKAIQVQLPDGRMSIPVLPTPDVQLRAGMWLGEMQFGRAVPQTEIVKAEMEAKDFEAVRALSEEELDRQIALLEAQNPIDAAFTVDSLDIWGEVFYSKTVLEQEEPL